MHIDRVLPSAQAHRLIASTLLPLLLVFSGASLRGQVTVLTPSTTVIAISANNSGTGVNAFLNNDSSVGFLQNGAILSTQSCQAFPGISSASSGAIYYDAAHTRVYLAMQLASGVAFAYESTGSTGNCTQGTVIEPTISSTSSTLEVNLDTSNGMFYALSASGGVFPDAFYVLPTATWSTSSLSSLNLDYSATYGPIVIDASTHIAYINDLSAVAYGDPGTYATSGFFVYDPAQSTTPASNLQWVEGYTSGSTATLFNVGTLLTDNQGKLVLVNANPGTTALAAPITVINTSASGFSFFANTTPTNSFSTAVNIAPGAALYNIAATQQYNAIGSADIDAANELAYVYTYSGSTSVTTPGMLLSYKLASGASSPETVLDASVNQPKLYLVSAPWGQLNYDPVSTQIVLTEDAVGAAALALTSPVCGGLPLTVTQLIGSVAGPDPTIAVPSVNAVSGYVYALQSPDIDSIAPPSTGCSVSTQVATTTSVKAVPTSAVVGSSVQLNVTVTPATGTTAPSGTVNFTSDDGTSISSGTLAGGSTSATTSALTTGARTITAAYVGGNGFSASSATTSVTINPAAPTFSPAAGSIQTGQTVSLSAATGATIYYTLTDTAPTTNSTLYNSPIPITGTSPVTIEAIAVQNGLSSTVATAVYTPVAPTQSGLAVLIPGIINSLDSDTGTAASIPSASAFDASGNFYILDSGLNTLTEYPVGAASKVIVSQSGQSVTLKTPSDMIAEPGATSLLISDYDNNRLVRVTLDSSITVTALAQTGIPAATASCTNTVAGTSLCQPTGLAEDSSGNIYVSDTGNGRVLKLTSAGSYIGTILSTGSSSPLAVPLGLALDSIGNLFVANSNGAGATGSILKIPAQGNVETISEAGIVQPYGLTVDPAGDLYFSDSTALTVSVLTAGGDLYLVAGNGTSADSGDSGPATSAGIASPLGVTLDASGNLFIADSVQQAANGGVIREVTATKSQLNFGNVTQGVASTPLAVNVLNAGPASLTIASSVVTGSSSADFALTDNCANQVGLDPGVTCPLTVTFTPSTASLEQARITITDNSSGASGATQVVQLTGGGVETGQAVATPSFSPVAGTYAATQNVSITSATSGAKIYYTTDGSVPPGSLTSILYKSPVAVSESETLTAVATAPGYLNSEVVTAKYDITAPPAAPPTFNPPAGAYTTAQTVSLSTTTAGASIYYTINGVNPPLLYSTPITVSQTETINAYAVAPGAPDSDTVSANYIIGPGFTMTGTFNGTPVTGIEPGLNTVSNVQVVVLTLTAVNGFTGSVTLSDTFNAPGNFQYGYCSDKSGQYSVSCTVTPASTGTTVYYTFSEKAPQTSPVALNRQPSRQGIRKQVTAASLSLLASIMTLALVGIFLPGNGFSKAVVCVCLIAITVSMGVILAGCTNTGTFTITAKPTQQGIATPQSVEVNITYGN